MINIREKIRVRIMQEALDLADRNDSEGYNAVKVMCTDVLGLMETPAAQPKQKPMHPEIKKMYEDYFDKCFRESSEPVPENFMDALKFDVVMRERVLTDANGRKYITTEQLRETLEQPEQVDCVGWFGYDTGLRLWFETNKGDDGAIPLYKDLQKRSWAGLTDDEIKEIVGPYGDVPIKGYTRKLFDQIEAALRSKNT